MRFRKSDQHGNGGLFEVNMTPLIDVSLVLVVMLLLTTPLAFESSIMVRRSERTAAKAAKKNDDGRIELRVMSANTVRVNRVVVPRDDLVDTLRPLVNTDTSDPAHPYFWTVGDDLWRIITDNPITWETVEDPDGGSENPDLSDAANNHAGWYFDFPVAGERVDDDVFVILGRLWFLTLIPEVTPCAYGGYSVFHEIDFETGGRLDYEVFDVNDDGVIDENDVIDGIPPSGVVINGNASMPASSQSGGMLYKRFTSTAGGLTTVRNRGLHLGLTHWREVD